MERKEDSKPLDPKLNHVEGALVGHQDPQKIHEKGEQDDKEKGVGDEISRQRFSFLANFWNLRERFIVKIHSLPSEVEPWATRTDFLYPVNY